MSTNQAAKLVYQLILFTNAFLYLVLSAKADAYHAIMKAVSKPIRE